MATKKKSAKKKLDKNAPGYYALIGRKGGRANLKKNGVEHFVEAARLSHKSPNRTRSAAQPEPDDDNVAGPRDKVSRRTRKTPPCN